MSTDDAVFEFNECPIRVRVVAGEPWFRGNDVAAALGYKRADVAIYKNVDARDKRALSALSVANIEMRSAYSNPRKGEGLEKDNIDVANIEMRSAYSNPRKGVGLEKDNIDVAFARNTAATIYINLSGVNALVFGSKLAAARAFKHWVTSDVLPAIQRTGEYRQSTDDRGREDHSDAVDPASATNPIDLRAENEKLRVQLAVERATAELRAEVATLRAKPTGVNDPIAIARAVDAFELVSTSASFSAIDKIFFHDRLKNSLAGASTCALLAVDTTPGAAPKTTDRLLVPLSDSVLKVTGRAFARPDYVPLGKLVAAGYRARHGDVAPPKVERFIAHGERVRRR
jgi:prophage antirepressor-like protein